MKFLVKIATRQRRQKVMALIATLAKLSSPKNEIKFLLSCDTDDLSMNNYNVRSIFKKTDTAHIFFAPRKTKIEAANRDIEKLNFNWDVLIVLDDDMMPKQQNWDSHIEQGFEEYFPDTDGALWLFDGHRKDLLTFAVMGKKYYSRFGYVYHPDYEGFFCDNEFMQVGLRLNRLKKIGWPECIIEHQHHVFTNQKPDALYTTNIASFQKDRQTYINREKNNFGLQ